MAMLSVEEARGQILQWVKPLESERVAIADALDRSLIEAVRANRTLPPWDNSAMDGYAVRSSDCTQPATLQVVETIFAGQRSTRSLQPGTCARIMTGAPLPPGADAVLQQERTQRSADTVTLEVPVPPGLNVRRAGEEVHAGAELLAAGTAVGIAEAAALWGQNLETVLVHRRPRVAICANGDELVTVGGDVGPGRIVDTNTPALRLAVERAQGIATPFPPAKDTLEAVTASVRQGLTFDVLICVAGASVGERDFTKDALEAAGVSMQFWRVAMKPGKPLAFGRKDNTLVFGLPGNPVSALVTFELFVAPALRALQGLGAAVPTERLVTSSALSKPAGLHHFIRAAKQADGTVRPLASQGSGSMASAMGATHLLSLPPSVTEFPAGSEVDAIPVSWRPK